MQINLFQLLCNITEASIALFRSYTLVRMFLKVVIHLHTQTLTSHWILLKLSELTEPKSDSTFKNSDYILGRACQGPLNVVDATAFKG
jgi:hypothetical protein